MQLLIRNTFDVLGGLMGGQLALWVAAWTAGVCGYGLSVYVGASGFVTGRTEPAAWRLVRAISMLAAVIAGMTLGLALFVSGHSVAGLASMGLGVFGPSVTGVIGRRVAWARWGRPDDEKLRAARSRAAASLRGPAPVFGWVMFAQGVGVGALVLIGAWGIWLLLRVGGGDVSSGLGLAIVLMASLAPLASAAGMLFSSFSPSRQPFQAAAICTAVFFIAGLGSALFFTAITHSVVGLRWMILNTMAAVACAAIAFYNRRKIRELVSTTTETVSSMASDAPPPAV